MPTMHPHVRNLSEEVSVRLICWILLASEHELRIPTRVRPNKAGRMHYGMHACPPRKMRWSLRRQEPAPPPRGEAANTANSAPNSSCLHRESSCHLTSCLCARHRRCISSRPLLRRPAHACESRTSFLAAGPGKAHRFAGPKLMHLGFILSYTAISWPLARLGEPSSP